MTKHTNGVKHEVFPGDSNGAPLMGWRAKPRLEMKLQASALPPAIMAAHALTTPMQAPQIHWVRLQHTISPKVWKLDLKNWGKSLNFSDSSWTSLNNMEWFLSFGYFSCGSCDLKRSFQRRPQTCDSWKCESYCCFPGKGWCIRTIQNLFNNLKSM